MLPFEFTVTGSPVSLQTNNRVLLQSWKAKVRQAAISRLPTRTVPTTEAVQVIITHYYSVNPPDIDNIAKPILDALNLIVYIDDKQITDLTVRKRDLSSLTQIQDVPNLIAQALAASESFICVKIDVSPDQTELSL
ncbi:MAG: RusA family crossover junction endodeoxyribonuclease [Cyanothece sp. SIO1E1]|nr:RusA family crossover junction endodeoxyribonuclease [Cyanothece sp. SIO1E1]